MKILLDEMWTDEIAVQLRTRGHDAAAVLERPELRSLTDAQIFAAAQPEHRVIVTENRRDFQALSRAAVQSGVHHPGLIFTSNHQFPRGDRRTIGRLVTALDRLLKDDPDLRNQEWWLPESSP